MRYQRNLVHIYGRCELKVLNNNLLARFNGKYSALYIPPSHDFSYTFPCSTIKGGGQAKFPGPWSHEGPAKFDSDGGLNNILMGQKPPFCPCTATHAQGPMSFIAPGPELALDGPVSMRKCIGVK